MNQWITVCVFQELEQKIISLMKKELKSFKRLLTPDYPACSEREEEEDEDQMRVREELLKITLHVLMKMKQTDLADKLQSSKREVIHSFLDFHFTSFMRSHPFLFIQTTQKSHLCV